MPFDYLIKGVEPEEYRILEKKKTKIIGSTMQGFNEAWQKRVRDIKISFTYNKKEKAIGITLDKNGTDFLALEKEVLSTKENAVVVSLYDDLEKELKNIRIRKGFWA